MECADRETMRALQLERLQEEVKYEYEHVPYYAEKMDRAGVKPEDIRTKDDLKKLVESEMMTPAEYKEITGEKYGK